MCTRFLMFCAKRKLTGEIVTPYGNCELFRATMLLQ